MEAGFGIGRDRRLEVLEHEAGRQQQEKTLRIAVLLTGTNNNNNKNRKSTTNTSQLEIKRRVFKANISRQAANNTKPNGLTYESMLSISNRSMHSSSNSAQRPSAATSSALAWASRTGERTHGRKRYHSHWAG